MAICVSNQSVIDSIDNMILLLQRAKANIEALDRSLTYNEEATIDESYRMVSFIEIEPKI